MMDGCPLLLLLLLQSKAGERPGRLTGRVKGMENG